MSASSSGSWAASAAPADIIDLDRYMRGGVRPATQIREKDDRLVVDAGGPGVKSSSSAWSGRNKRYSHDSGLSDGSYRRRHKSKKCNRGLQVIHSRRSADGRTRSSASSASMRTFRAVCQQALRDQQVDPPLPLPTQEQIARVAAICERLAERRPRSSSASSELSSSSRTHSTRDPHRADKRRTDECKTYKIIMSKLDELSRLFATRGRPQPGGSPPAARVSASKRPGAAKVAVAQSSATVSVRDRRVGPESVAAAKSHNISICHQSTSSRLVERATGGSRSSQVLTGSPRLRSPRSPRLEARKACALDITPQEAMPMHNIRNNVGNESVVEFGTTDSTVSSARDERCGFDLDDPVHLYAQAKRLQALYTNARKSGGVTRAPNSGRASKVLGGATKLAGPSLCAICRSYWRALRTCVVQQFNKLDISS